MLEKLKEYLKKFEAEKHALETADDEALVAEAVKHFEADYRAQLAKNRADCIAKKETAIQVINELISLETDNAIAELAQEDNAEDLFQEIHEEEIATFEVSAETTNNF